MRRVVKRTLLLLGGVLAIALLVVYGPLLWPDPFFAYRLGTGKIVVASDRPIPTIGGERFLADCERLLERSPLKATSAQYHIYIANEPWRHRLFFILAPEAWGLTFSYFGGPAVLSRIDFEKGRVVHFAYVGTPPRTPAWLCAHELTHIVETEHAGRFSQPGVPTWVWEGIVDYAGIENRETYEQLRDALGDRPVNIPMMVRYGSYPRYRLLVTYFIEKKGWTADQLLQSKLTESEATAIMHADAK